MTTTAIIAALSLGAAGSLHCVGMCGPLMLALPAATGRQRLPLSFPILYHGGRILSYAVLGSIAGIAGHSVRFVVGQELLSLTVGILILLALFMPKSMRQRLSMLGPVRRAWSKLHASWNRAAKAGGFGWIAMGALNGLLPCGLVYAAVAGAAATGHALTGAAFMALFGLANAPALIAVSTVGSRIPKFRAISHRIVPIAAITVAGLLILRGLALDVPYLSPNLATKSNAETPSCCSP